MSIEYAIFGGQKPNKVAGEAALVTLQRHSVNTDDAYRIAFLEHHQKKESVAVEDGQENLKRQRVGGGSKT